MIYPFLSGLLGIFAAAFVIVVYLHSHRRVEPPRVVLIDPADRRVWNVREDYANGHIADDDLEWAIVLALKPPEPKDLSQWSTATAAWSAAPPSSSLPWTAAAHRWGEQARAIHDAMRHPVSLGPAAQVVPIAVGPMVPQDSAPADPEERKRFADAEWARLHAEPVPSEPDERLIDRQHR